MAAAAAVAAVRDLTPPTPRPSPPHWQGKSTAELLKQMYAEADEVGKVALSKAWEEGREKREGTK